MSDKEKYELIKFLKEMIAKFPNDQDLGKELAKIITMETLKQ